MSRAARFLFFYRLHASATRPRAGTDRESLGGERPGCCRERAGRCGAGTRFGERRGGSRPCRRGFRQRSAIDARAAPRPDRRRHFDLAVLAMLLLLAVALGRPTSKRWLAQRHGAQVLLLWGAMVLYTFVSCASALADAFSTRAHEQGYHLSLVLWLALVIVTWRWGSARGDATRAR